MEISQRSLHVEFRPFHQIPRIKEGRPLTQADLLSDSLPGAGGRNRTDTGLWPNALQWRALPARAVDLF